MFINTTVWIGNAVNNITAVLAMMAWLKAWCVLIFLEFVLAEDLRNSTFVIKPTESCPTEGYYFRRDPAPNAVYPGPCYLCFCQSNASALCWSRDTHRCDVENYHHHRVGRESRVRRSPVGLSDIFFRDAARDFFNRQAPSDCKPYESSFSDGCPPDDWCTGCTICDCDANGHWDCHILSFCNGKEKKEKVKNPREKDLDEKSNLNSRHKHKKSKLRNTSSKPKETKRGFIQKVVQNYAPVKIKAQNKRQANNEVRQTKNIQKNKTSIINGKTNKLKQNISTNLNAKYTAKIKQKKEDYKKDKAKKRVKKVIVINKPLKNNQQKKLQNKSIILHSKRKAKKRDAFNRNQVSLIENNIIHDLNKNSGNNSMATRVLGEKIVKQVMQSVHKILIREMDKINATRMQRSINGKGCGDIKKSDKDTFNIKSKAATRNKRKHKRLTAMLKGLEHARNKREILNETEVAMENVTIISLEPENTAVIPLSTVIPKNKVIDTTTPPVIIASSSQYNDYYKYTIKDDITTINNEQTEKLPEIKNTVSSKLKTYTPFSNPKSEISTTTTVILKPNNKSKAYNNSREPEFNDVKFTKWYLIKVMPNNTKRTHKKLRIRKLYKPKAENKKDRALFKIKGTVRVPITQILNIPSVTRKDIFNTQKKDEITSTEVTTTVDLFKKLTTNLPQISKLKNSNGIHNILNNFLPDTKNNKTNTNVKGSILKSLRTFFKQIFNKKDTATRKNRFGMAPREGRTLQVLCEHFVKCNINKRNKFILKYKIKRLNEESENIMKLIGIIKGLLKLLELPINDMKFNLNCTAPTNNLQRDLHKFKAVLKGNYDLNNNGNLTETQLFQIQYIKKNTKAFIQSVKRFMGILKDILRIVKEDSGISHNIYPKRHNSTVPLIKIKKLLSKYNFIQNSFIKKMYQLLTRFEVVTEKPHTRVSENNVSTVNDEVIMRFSTNIINKLRKLKNLAQALSYRERRKKRHAIVKRDDTLEYLVTLLEFLLKKQTYPLDILPANDGIDFLIDAIKNTPDIKPVRQKSFQFTPVTTSLETITPKVSTDVEIADTDYSDSYINKVLPKEEVKEFDDNTLTNDINGTVESIENEVTTGVYYQKIDDITENYNEIFSDNFTNYGSTKKRREESLELGDKIEDTKKDQLDSEGSDEIIPKSAVIVNLSNKIINTASKTPININKETENITPSSAETGINEKKKNLDWIEESFDKEIKDFGHVNVTDKPSTITAYTTESSKSRESGIDSKEGIDKMGAYIAKPMERLEKLDPEEVMRRKQIEFLSSLDYGTGKPEFDDVEAKDDVRTDDSFSSYS